MTTLEQAARQALETLERASDAGYSVECDETITALREALEQAAPKAAPESFLDGADVQDESRVIAYYSREAVFACITAALESVAATKAAPGKRLTREQIREVFMAHGFTIKEGQTDLKQYVYDAAYALLELVAAPPAEQQAAPKGDIDE